MDDRFDVAIVGAGIVGLATGLALQQRRPRYRVVVLDKEQTVAAHQSGHNSGVIHTGIYYLPGTRKAELCVEGGRRLREFCDEAGIPHASPGKVIIARSAAERPRLEELARRAAANQIPGGAELIGPERLGELEPHAVGMAALHVPQAGVVDYRLVARAMAERFQRQGGLIRLGERVVGIVEKPGGTRLLTERGQLTVTRVVNCAGLFSDVVAKMAGVKSPVRIVPFRGEYYQLRSSRDRLVRALIYPVPDPRFPFLGVHFTRGIDGTVEAGPNAVLAFAREGYRRSTIRPQELMGTLIAPGFLRLARTYWRTGLAEMGRSYSKRAFTRALQRLVPEVAVDDLKPGGSGVRAQAVDRSGKLVDDFVIRQTGNGVHVLNAPSPAATASLAIGAAIAELVD